jgi:DNA-nicking Smr family endonuclease
VTSRRPTQDEVHLFRDTVKDARPIRKRTRVPLQKPKAERFVVRENLVPPPALDTRAAAIGGHKGAHLRRGKLEPEARFDLHGFTQEKAYGALLRFLTRAYDQDFRLVLVITGKGQILRGQLPLWLGQKDLKPMISGVSEAHAGHGGAGAFYIALRTKSKRR